MAFDLDKSIAAWRRSLRFNRLFLREDLDELEAHVRDYVEDRAAGGIPEEQAFREALNRLGDRGGMEAEYRKVRWGRTRWKQYLAWSAFWEGYMLKNYFTVAFRNLVRHRGYTFINVSGLAIGMASCLLILLYVRHELSYDRYHENADRTYRVTREWFDENGTTTLHLARVAAPAGPLIEQNFPEVEAMARTWGGEFLVSKGDEHYTEDDFYFAEPAFLDLFTVRFLQGDPTTALTEPNTLVLTASVAEKYFGKENPIGQTLVVSNEDVFTVTGVVADPPRNTHFHFNILGSFATLTAAYPADTWTNWGWNNYATYLLLAEGADPEVLEARFPALLDAHFEPEASSETRLHLQAIRDIHLYSHLDSELAPPGDIRYVYLFSAIAFFLLLIACFNFVNLATARATQRAREVGVRKVLGANRQQLIRQFLGEALLLTAVALIVSLILVRMALPIFNNFAGKALSLFGTDPAFTLLSLGGLLLFIGVAAGGYPAFFLSGYQPALVLKGAVRGSWRSRFRTALVVSQFVIAIVLLVGMGVIYHQLDYVQSKRLGFDREQLVVMPASGMMRQDLEALRQRLLAHPNIRNVAASQRVPSDPLLDTIDGSVEVDGTLKPFRDLPSVSVDPGFIETFGMTMAAGRNFSHERASDSTGAFILNEAAVRLLGWGSPEAAIGKGMVLERRSSGSIERGEVIGVVEDFHFESLHERIAPLVFYIHPDYFWQITVKIADGDIPATLDFLEAQWQQYLPNHPLEYTFVDEEFGALYESEQRLAMLFGLFAGLAILIACLGLFGLASFIAEQRTKEIGIRKALGATVTSVVLLLSRDFARLVFVALLIAIPIAYLLMDRWLESFAYHTRLSLWIFPAAGMVALSIALLTVSYQALRAATMDPVKTLRYE